MALDTGLVNVVNNSTLSADGTYVKVAKTVAGNLIALDTAVKGHDDKLGTADISSIGGTVTQSLVNLNTNKQAKISVGNNRILITSDTGDVIASSVTADKLSTFIDKDVDNLTYYTKTNMLATTELSGLGTGTYRGADRTLESQLSSLNASIADIVGGTTPVGKAAEAEKAYKDGDNRVITETYATKEELDGAKDAAKIKYTAPASLKASGKVYENVVDDNANVARALDAAGNAVDALQTATKVTDASAYKETNDTMSSYVERLSLKVKGNVDAIGTADYSSVGATISQALVNLDATDGLIKIDVQGLKDATAITDQANTNYLVHATGVGNAVSILDKQIGKIPDNTGNYVKATDPNDASKLVTVSENLLALDKAIGAYTDAIATGETATNYMDSTKSVYGNLGLLDQQIKINEDHIGNISIFTDTTNPYTGHAAGATNLVDAIALVDAAVDAGSADAKAYTDRKFSGENEDGSKGSVVLGNKANTITIGEVLGATSNPKSMTGMFIDTQNDQLELATAKDEDQVTNISLDAATRQIVLGYKDFDNALNDYNMTIDAKNFKTVVGTSTDYVTLDKGSIIATGDISATSGKVEAKDIKASNSATVGDTSSDKYITLENGEVTASKGATIGTGDHTVSIANGNVTATDTVAAKDLTASNSATIGTGANTVTVTGGNVTATGTVDANAVTAKTGAFDTSVTVGSGDGLITISNTGEVNAKDLVARNSATIGTTGDQTVIDGNSITSTKVTGDTTRTVEIADGEIKLTTSKTGETDKVVDIKDGNITASGAIAAHELDVDVIDVGDLEVDKLTLAGKNLTAVDTGTNVTTGSATTVATTATLAATVGNVADLNGGANGNLAKPVGDVKPTVRDHLIALDASIGSVSTDTNNYAKADTIGGNIDILDGELKLTNDALGATKDAQTGKYKFDTTGDNTPNYGLASTDTVQAALKNINGNIGTAEQLGPVQNGVTKDKTVNQNIAALNSKLGDMEGLLNSNLNLTNGESGLPASAAVALDNIDKTLGTVHGLSDKLREAGAYYGNLAEKDEAGKSSLEAHLTAIDKAIGDRSKYVNTAGSNGYTATVSQDISKTMTEIASNIGTANDLGEAYNSVSSANTVNKNIASLNAAIGDVSTLSQSIYVSETSNVTDAVRVLDANMYRLDNQVNDLNNKYKKLRKDFHTGMASMAAMSALAPNARSSGDTQLSVGTGAYSGHTAAAVGAYHWLTDNLLLNAGMAWGNSSDTVYRMGVTYSW